MLLQQLWLTELWWDDSIPSPIQHYWENCQREFPILTEQHIPQCYFQYMAEIVLTQLHGFSDAYEQAYEDVMYLRATDSEEAVEYLVKHPRIRLASYHLNKSEGSSTRG